MKVIIAGSRNITDYNILLKAIEEANQAGIFISEIVSGGAKGIDSLAERFADILGIQKTIIPVSPADWNRLGKMAGRLRNLKLLGTGAEALIAVWDGKSPGTKHMISIAKKINLKVFIHITK